MTIRSFSLTTLLFVLSGVVTACQGDRSGEGQSDAGDDASSTGGEGAEGSSGDDDGPKYDVGDGVGEGGADGGGSECDDVSKPTPNAMITGTVYAPNQEIPIANALVYTSPTPPEPIPDHVYCETCVELPCERHWVLTEADGSFSLPAVAGEDQYLVVQKGQFMRSTLVDVPAGANPAGAGLTSLPRERKPEEGKWIPNMAVMHGGSDSIRDVLAKAGLGGVTSQGALNYDTENFTLFGGPGSNGGSLSAAALLNDLDEMRKYHYIFFPCGSEGSFGVEPIDVMENMRTWVEEGGSSTSQTTRTSGST